MRGEKSMHKYYCRECKIDKLNAIKQIIKEAELLDSDYKKRKLNKHITFNNCKGRLSIFNNGSSDLYGANIIEAIDSKESFFKEITGLLTLINPTTNILGTLYENGIRIGQTNTAIVANSTQPDRIHVFTDMSSNYENARCSECNKKLYNPNHN